MASILEKITYPCYNSAMYTVKEVNARKEWEKVTENVLLQSWNWGEFQTAIGNRVIRLGVYRGKDLIGAAQAILVKSKLRSHIYIPNGPVLADQQSYVLDGHKLAEVAESVLDYCRKNLVSRQTHFIRMDPLLIASIENLDVMHDLGLISASTYVQPERTILIDLKKSEADLLAQMTITQRYGVKKGIKEGITVTCTTTDKDFEIFWKIFNDAVKRQKFVSYPKNYYAKQLQILKEDGNYQIYIAYDKEKPVAAALMASDHLHCYYLHAARDYSADNAAKYSPKVLLWHAMCDAKKESKEFFNLYGIAKNDEDKNDPWYGFSEFKKSFGGDVISYVGALDFPITLNYWFIRILESSRRLWGYPYYIAKRLLGKA